MTSPIEQQLHRLTDNESTDFREIYRSSGTLPVTRKAMSQLVDLAVGHFQYGAAPGASRIEAALQRFRQRGRMVSRISDIRHLHVDEVDEVAGSLCFRYQAMALADAHESGFAGIPASLADMPSLLGLSLRAIGEVATHFGFDVEDVWERKFALLVLTVATASRGSDKPGPDTRSLAAVYPGAKEQPLSAEFERRIAEGLVIRLVRGKLIDGRRSSRNFNRSYVEHVCETARTIYRERLLFAQYSERAAAAAE